MKKALEVKNLTKIYLKNKSKIYAIKEVDVDFKYGNFYAIMGKSGSGKTTLIKSLGLLCDFNEGKIRIDDEEINKLKENEKAKIRFKKIGFIFQNYYLNPLMNSLENVMIPLFLNKNIKNKERIQIATNMLIKFDLKDRKKHFPNELSGGEKQRVAIARAIINNPNIILADEPTGNLDNENEEYVFKYLKKLSLEGKCVIVVSHNEKIKKYADEVYIMSNGKIIKEAIK